MRIAELRARLHQPASHNRFSVIVAGATLRAAHDAHNYTATLRESYVLTAV